MRKNIYDILKNAKIDIKKEYSRIFELFYEVTYSIVLCGEATLEELVEANFSELDRNLIGRCLSLEDFNVSYKYNFVPQPNEFDIDMLVNISEYVVNFVRALMRLQMLGLNSQTLMRIEQHIDSCMEDIGYKQIHKDNLVIYVEKNPLALSVVENVDEELAYSVLEYNHFKMKGDLLNKKNVLKNMIDDIENDRRVLNSINKGFTSDLFQLFNKFIRHDNSDNLYISSLSDSELEDIYDELYEMWLLAKAQIENFRKKAKIRDIIEKIN